MRGLGVSLQGEDFMLLADAKGLRRLTIFVRYAIRNAPLAQITGLGMALGQIVSIVSIGLVTLVLDLVYPLLDPRLKVVGVVR